MRLAQGGSFPQIPGPGHRPLESCSEDSNAFGKVGNSERGGEGGGRRVVTKVADPCHVPGTFLSVLQEPAHSILITNP